MTQHARFGAFAASLLLGAALALSPSAGFAKKPAPDPKPPAAGAVKCGPHQHEVTEIDPDEGGKVTRCVCDEGWDEGGPGAPCKQKKDAKPAK